MRMKVPHLIPCVDRFCDEQSLSAFVYVGYVRRVLTWVSLRGMIELGNSER